MKIETKNFAEKRIWKIQEREESWKTPRFGSRAKGELRHVPSSEKRNTGKGVDLDGET